MASQGILLVSAEKIKSFTNINTNLDESLILPMVQVSQEIGLQTLLGSRFYFHLLDAVQNNTLTPAEQTLIEDYISPYLIWRSVYEALPEIYMRMMNKGISIGESPNSKAADRGDLSYLRNIHQNRYEFYSQRMMDYLQYRQADYPDYFNYTYLDGMTPSKENYFGGIHISPGVRKLPRFINGMPSYTDPTGPFCCGDYNW